MGFTITKGFHEIGGGIYCFSSSSPTIKDNTIWGNTVYNYGGGIACYLYADAIITGNTITGNIQIAPSYAGGGIFCSFSSPTITDNTISQNTASWGGGGYCYSSAPTVASNTIEGNVANDGAGGGFMTVQSPSEVVITGNTITGNTAYGAGGLTCQTGSSRIENNIISGNTAGFGGGGGFVGYYESSTISNNIITNNAGDSLCGGIGFMYSSATMNNNTIAENYSTDGGGGIILTDSCMVTVTNTIFWNNDAPTGDEIWIGYYSSNIPSTLTIEYSDVERPEESVFVDEGCTLNWGNGMIDADPEFVLPDKRDYRLLWGSPCIDFGDPTLFDPDGTRSDMGAHYFNQDDFITLYLTPDTTEVLPGDELGVTYTAINRWNSPEICWLLSQARRSTGSWFSLMGPDPYTLPANHTAQVQIMHTVPNMTPAGMYEYRSLIGMPPGTLYDEDSFKFRVVE
jgi:parallel beta-helix repeat protein